MNTSFRRFIYWNWGNPRIFFYFQEYFTEILLVQEISWQFNLLSIYCIECMKWSSMHPPISVNGDWRTLIFIQCKQYITMVFCLLKNRIPIKTYGWLCWQKLSSVARNRALPLPSPSPPHLIQANSTFFFSFFHLLQRPYLGQGGSVCKIWDILVQPFYRDWA